MCCDCASTSHAPNRTNVSQAHTRLPATKHENTISFVFDSCSLIVPINIYPIKFVFSFAPFGERGKHLATSNIYLHDMRVTFTESIYQFDLLLSRLVNRCSPSLVLVNGVTTTISKLKFVILLWILSIEFASFPLHVCKNISIDGRARAHDKLLSMTGSHVILIWLVVIKVAVAIAYIEHDRTHT